MLVRGTRKFLDRIGPPGTGDQVADGVLGDWYANALLWRPQTALFVNERSLFPVLLRLAPAATVLDRFPAAFARVAAGIGVDRVLLDAELSTMRTHALAKTASRRVLVRDHRRARSSTRAHDPSHFGTYPSAKYRLGSLSETLGEIASLGLATLRRCRRHQPLSACEASSETGSQTRSGGTRSVSHPLVCASTRTARPWSGPRSTDR